MKAQFFVLFLFFHLTALADPWGKDSDLTEESIKSSKLSHQNNQRCKTVGIGPVAEILIRFHQEVISPCDGPRSHFLPSSSQYTLNAMRKYGFYPGFLMGCDRLMRENDESWVYRTGVNGGTTMKLDPVR